MAARILVCTLRGAEAEQARWMLLWIRWGAPGNTLWGGGCVLSADSHSSIQIADPRAQPLVFSPDGWGEGEQAGFALSAWMGFVVMLLLGLVPWLPKHISKALPMYIGNIGNAQLFDSWRAAAETFMSGWSSQLHLRSTLGVLHGRHMWYWWSRSLWLV